MPISNPWNQILYRHKESISTNLRFVKCNSDHLELHLYVIKVVVVPCDWLRHGQPLPIGQTKGIGGPPFFAPDGRGVAAIKIETGEVEPVPIPF